MKDLKTGKCKDTDNYIFELFKDGVVGTDLRKSLIPLFNRMKNAIKIPECLRISNITILHKKYDKLELNDWRGIFLTSVLRALLMKLIYVLKSVLNDVMKKKKKTVNINVLDFKQMFDAEEVPHFLNSMYEAGI